MLSAAVCAMAFSANADVADEVVIAEAIQASAFDSIYAGLGIGGSFLTGDEIAYHQHATATDATAPARINHKPKANRFIGSFVIGGGKVFNNKIYAGAEFLMDFTKNKKFESDALVVNSIPTTNDPNNGTFHTKVGGFIPQLSAKFGYAFNKCTLAYLKLGCAWTKLSVDSVLTAGTAAPATQPNWSKTKAAFVLGLGAEKAFCKKFSVAVEGDYNFGWKNTFANINDAHRNTTNNEVSSRFNKGWTVRALVKYNVKY